MGLFDQMKMAQDMMKNMSPDQIQKLTAQAKESQKMLQKQIEEAVAKEIAERQLVSRSEVEDLINQKVGQ